MIGGVHRGTSPASRLRIAWAASTPVSDGGVTSGTGRSSGFLLAALLARSPRLCASTIQVQHAAQVLRLRAHTLFVQQLLKQESQWRGGREHALIDSLLSFLLKKYTHTSHLWHVHINYDDVVVVFAWTGPGSARRGWGRGVEKGNQKR